MPDSRMTDRKMLMEIYDMTKRIHDHLFTDPMSPVKSDNPPESEKK